MWPFIARSLEISTILLLAAIGELLDERSGVLNVGIEGIMLLGAAAGFIVGDAVGGFVGLLVGAAVGGLIGFLHGVFSISLKVDQVVSGMGIWLFAMGFVTYWADRYSGPLDTKIPKIYDLSPMFPIALLTVFLIWFVLAKTHIGLKIRAVGENPFAAEVSGVDFIKIRYLCVVVGGALGGLAGASLIISYLGAWSHLPTKGLGWVALALVMFSLWRPLILLGGSLLFGFLWQLAISPETIYAGIPAPLPVLRMIPFIMTILFLVVISTETFRKKWALAKPESLGIPFFKE
ncbi:MAG TPA: ABC transporter permease [Candidatus Caldiarchaeum subterraneum]|uniref:ABC transporter permease n=1 Tax=Caldiarchaeum subterraneum TaxID=311458 RepID=A0A832ZU69_CALS0|nr:ABC transporter permease [Aigarchaeota archaeon]HIQ29078.1 ABC transporter permease [Candidatus Caldarchaeum subterraneum]